MENVKELEECLEEYLEVNITDPYGFIYITTNMINGKKYIGQKIFQGKWQNYLGSGTYFLRSVRKYGKNNFSREIIAIAYSKKELNELEIEYVDNHNAIISNNYYNLVSGGNGTSGFHLSDEIKNKMSKAKRYSFSDENPNAKELKRKFSIAKTGGNNPKAVKVICVTTGEVFDCMTSASNKYGIHKNKIWHSCNGNTKSGSKLKDGTKLIWMYYEQYISANEKQIEKILNKILHSKIICLTTNEIFNTQLEAGIKYNINTKTISKCCRGKVKSAGKHPETKEKLVWMYLKDYQENIKICVSK